MTADNPQPFRWYDQSTDQYVVSAGDYDDLAARTAQPSREALLAIIGEAEEVTIHQHGNPHRALDAIIVRARAALAAAPAPAQGIDHDHGGGLHSHTIHVSSAEGGGLHHHDVATSR